MGSKLLKQDGLTLIELLLTLTIFSIVGTIVFNVFINGMNYSNKAQSNVNLQQEANRVITQLTAWHEKENQYNISLDKNPFATTITLSGSKQVIISDPRYKYSICYYDNNTEKCNETNKSLNKIDKELSIKLLIIDANNNDRTFEIKTILSRM